MKRFLVFFLIFISYISAYADDALDYLNTLRKQAGLVTFSTESHLQTAAQNHSDYMQINNVSGHYESSDDEGYTGESVLERVLYADYQSRVVSENVSWESHGTYQSSIDLLFAAIYHRYGFLNMSVDEIGIGISDNNEFYTYDMGYSSVNDLCVNGTYTSGDYVTGVCKDSDKKIEIADWENAINQYKSSSPDIVVWPAENGTDVLPVFYEETPDPLPDDNVSGYPVSIEFNDQTFTTPPTFYNLEIVDPDSGETLETLSLMNKENDPNAHLTDYQFVNFPKKRFEWGNVYQAVLTYSYNDNNYTKRWSFKTRSLQNVAERFYRIENSSDVSLNIVSGKSYAIYIVPNNTNDLLGGVGYRYNTDAPELYYIDKNTIWVKASGDADEYIEFTFDNGQKITLTIASSDTAIEPVDEEFEEATENTDTTESTDTSGSDDSQESTESTDSSNDASTTATDDDTQESVDGIDTDDDGIIDEIDTDDDNDGISDKVELANGLDPLDDSDAQKDFDNDGFSNIIELGLGLDIRSAKSHPVWTPVVVNGLIILVPSK